MELEKFSDCIKFDHDEKQENITFFIDSTFGLIPSLAVDDEINKLVICEICNYEMMVNPISKFMGIVLEI